MGETGKFSVGWELALSSTTIATRRAATQTKSGAVPDAGRSCATHSLQPPMQFCKHMAILQALLLVQIDLAGNYRVLQSNSATWKERGKYVTHCMAQSHLPCMRRCCRQQARPQSYLTRLRVGTPVDPGSGPRKPSEDGRYGTSSNRTCGMPTSTRSRPVANVAN